MPGLGLKVGGFGGNAGTYVPAPASQPGTASVGAQAFGVYSAQTAGPGRAAAGAVILGASAAALLAWLWWTLPR